MPSSRAKKIKKNTQTRVNRLIYDKLTTDERVGVVRLGIESDKDTRSVNILNFAKSLGIKTYYTDYAYGDYIEWNHKTGEYSIYICENVSVPARRYALAHNVAHFLLHKKTIKEQGHMDKSYLKGITMEPWMPKEFEARLLASELLVPEIKLMEDLEDDAGLLQKDNLIRHIQNNYIVTSSLASLRASRALKYWRKLHNK